ncbi:hypothetical protein B4U80_05636 [Leptotrombidium deliense]|uniref:Uncharacterized protein n=1 Tax=Leptotrombidium deliense TaxID=299467 RepID=A0A443SEM9_9ACAR|nr:hypothetical protein B4U80_05636 [Leptotrombidium deliense]
MFRLNMKLENALLRNFGINPGDVFIVYGANSYEFLVAFLSGLIAGGTAMSIREVDTKYEMKKMILWTEAKFVFVGTSVRETALFLKNEFPTFQNIIVFDTQFDDCFPTVRNFINEYSETIVDEFIYEPKDCDEIAVILESSGISGAMKATKLGHYDLATCYCRENNTFISDTISCDVFSGHSHMSHHTGLSAHLMSIIYGAKIVSFRSTDVNQFLNAVENYKISRATITPSMLNLINKSDRNFDLSSLQHLFIGGSRVSKKLIDIFLKNHEIEELRNVYTMTELTIQVTRSDNKRCYEAIGKVCPGIEIKVINAKNGQLLGENKTGELCVRSPIKFKGYFKDDNASKELLDDDGWIHTGDIGYFDESENFFIVDRSKDIIKQHGFSYSPVDVEDVFLEHNAVKEAALIGIPYSFEEEIAHAFVVLHKKFEDKINEEDLLHFVNNRTSKIREVKGGVHFVNEIPKTNVGKILRRKLRDVFFNNNNKH